MTKLGMVSKEVTEETEDLITKNLEVEDINAQLKMDLDVCKRHLENVYRANATVTEELELYKKTNMLVIKKLKKPLDEGWSEIHTKAKSEMAESTTDNFQPLRI